MLAVLDPFSGVSGDMLLGALVDVGLDEAWLHGLPAALGLQDIGVRITRVQRASLSAVKVDFDIPPQPHGRHLQEILEVLQRAEMPERVRERCVRVFQRLTQVEATIHGVGTEDVHLHEVGAVDAILDVVGTTWGLEQLGVTRLTVGPISLGDGFVRAAHGVLPVPAPATLRLLEGLVVRPGPEGTGELVTPTGAALVGTLAEGAAPAAYTPRRSGYGAGTKDLLNRPNVLRLILGDAVGAPREQLVVLACDIDDQPGEAVAEAAERLREAGALDVWLTSSTMKKGRLGTRLEVLCVPGDLSRLEGFVFRHTTTIGVRHWTVERTALARDVVVVEVFGSTVRVKMVELPDGSRRFKPEHDDVSALARQQDLAVSVVSAAAIAAAERQ